MITTDVESVFELVAPLSGLCPTRKSWVSAIGRIRDGRLVGGFIVEDFTGTSARFHAAGVTKDWCTPSTLKVFYWYVFKQLGCAVLRCSVLSSNTGAVAQCLRMGFTIEAVLKDATPDADEIILSMRRDDCRFLRVE